MERRGIREQRAALQAESRFRLCSIRASMRVGEVKSLGACLVNSSSCIDECQSAVI